jgi:hypothetical protein
MITNALKIASLGIVLVVSVVLLSACSSPDLVAQAHPFVPVAAAF